MSELQVETVTQDGAEWVRVPEGHLVCLVARDAADGVWRECCAVRIVAAEDGTVAAFEATNDLDWLTSPEADRAA